MASRSKVNPLQKPAAANPEDAEAIVQFRERVGAGEHWFTAMLSAMKSWRSPIEEYEGRTFRYVYGNEAFDYLVLAERLCEAARDLIPEEEWERLILEGIPPISITIRQFKELLGPEKYRAHLNFLYGIAAEEALQLSLEEAFQKDRMFLGAASPYGDLAETFPRLYDAPFEDLLGEFRRDHGLPDGETISWSDHREFTYWLFKYRLKATDKARIAANTRRALDQLEQMRSRLLQRSPTTAYTFADGDLPPEPLP